jgi:hypothetical protein
MSGDLKGTSRMPTGFTTPDDADPRLQNMLTLYKQPATIRDMKQVYFYSDVVANLTNIEPLIQQYGVNIAKILPPTSGSLSSADITRALNMYYARIGTTRTLDISSVVSDLIDIRVPKDKYLVEINLAECTLEVDSDSWQSLPDFVIRYGAAIDAAPVLPAAAVNGPLEDIVNRDPVYNFQLEEGGVPVPGTIIPPRYTYISKLTQAKKKTEPQTLYLRIKELSNGEPYNWAVTNSGNYSIDKGHQLLIRHGDVNYSNLTLEFGHLGFIGNDADYSRFLENPDENDLAVIDNFRETAQNTNTLRKTNINIHNYSNYRYFDYNTEVFNVVGAVDHPTISMYSNYAYNDVYNYPNAIYPKFYGGINNEYAFKIRVPPALPSARLARLEGRDDDNVERPANRPPFKFVGYRQDNSVIPTPDSVVYDESDTPETDPTYCNRPYLLQGSPLFFNQQVSKIGFRFLVRVIHLF